MNRRSFFRRTLAAVAALVVPFRLSKRRARASEPSARVIVYTRRCPGDPWTAEGRKDEIALAAKAVIAKATR